MTPKPVIPRAQAVRDVEAAIDYLSQQAGQATALQFVSDLEQAFEVMARHPSSGSPRYAHELNLPGLRCSQLRRFPYLLFSIEKAGHIDLWRVLHAHRDIPASMRSTTDDL